MHAEQEMQQLKGRIAEVYARREQLKQALASGALAPRTGLAQLGETDRELSDLDTRYKTLWDAHHGRAPKTSHPAAAWARKAAFEPLHLDCVTAIMLKILDAKCKMGEADKQALAAVYDVVMDRPGQGLDGSVHDLVAAARRGMDAELAERIHDWRVRAEAAIPKPVMKAFKEWLRAVMPMQ
jgi:hypothetical protein